jgi:hypothetical protein
VGRVGRGVGLALIAWAVLLALPTYELVFASHPNEDRGGYACRGSAISTALHPGFIYQGKETLSLNIPKACDQDAKRDILFASLLDGIPLLVILGVSILNIRSSRRHGLIADPETWRLRLGTTNSVPGLGMDTSAP